MALHSAGDVDVSHAQLNGHSGDMRARHTRAAGSIDTESSYLDGAGHQADASSGARLLTTLVYCSNNYFIDLSGIDLSALKQRLDYSNCEVIGALLGEETRLLPACHTERRSSVIDNYRFSDFSHIISHFWDNSMSF
jgi:hypothetical protein